MYKKYAHCVSKITITYELRHVRNLSLRMMRSLPPCLQHDGICACYLYLIKSYSTIKYTQIYNLLRYKNLHVEYRLQICIETW